MLDTQAVQSDELAGDIANAAEAYMALAQARARLHAHQRAAVLGVGNPDALDAAVLSYRRARAAAAAMLPPAELADSPPAERFAGWLVEAALRGSPRAS